MSRRFYNPLLTTGFTPVVTSSNSILRYIEGGFLKLDSADQIFNGDSGSKEIGINIISGIVSVTAETGENKPVSFENIGCRMNPFEGNPFVLYFPAKTRYSLRAVKTPFYADVFAVQGGGDYLPFVIRPSEVQAIFPGQLNWKREVRLLISKDMPAFRLIMGETLVSSGNWCNFPPHKHDINNLPFEAASEELYSYHFDKPEGFGLIRLFSKGDNGETHDEAYVLTDGTMITVDGGYHPMTVSPGYRCCQSFCLAGEQKAYGQWTNDPMFEWILRSEVLLH
jgi:5-deoxy-glucuronate isomerase